MKAIIARNKEGHLVDDRPEPKLRDDYILVKPAAVALNPTDWKHITFGLASDNCLIGCDFAGTVQEVGSAVTKQFKKGDRIAGVAHGGNAVQPEDGAFAQKIVAKGDVQMKIPDSMSWEEASTLTLGVTTVMQGLYQKGLNLSWPDQPSKDGESLLIYGGSSATGALGIQFAKLSGYKVLTTCSPRNFDYVKSLGASEVFDYNDSSAPQKIRDLTSNNLTKVWDTISEEGSAKFCAGCLAEKDSGLTYATILPVKSPREDVESIGTLMYTIFGEKFNFAGNDIPASSEDFEYTKKFLAMVEGLLKDGKIKAHKQTVGKGGLKGVLEGLENMRQGKVSGEKLVYLVDETP